MERGFLNEIQTKNLCIPAGSGEILIGAVSFYNQKNDREFFKKLNEVLELPSEKEAKTKQLREVLRDTYQFPDCDTKKKIETN